MSKGILKESREERNKKIFYAGQVRRAWAIEDEFSDIALYDSTEKGMENVGGGESDGSWVDRDDYEKLLVAYREVTGRLREVRDILEN